MNRRLDDDDLFDADIPMARVPVCLALDTSGSMNGKKIDQLNNGIKLFFECIKNDDIARYAADVTIITFGLGGVERILKFGNIEEQIVPTLKAGSITPMGQAVSMAMDVLEARKKLYSDNGVEYFQPWLVLMTDGTPTDDIDEASKRCCELINSDKLTIFPIGIGDYANMTILKEFSPKSEPIKLGEVEFEDFFEWLSNSVAGISVSVPGIPIDCQYSRDWKEVNN